MGQQAQLGPLLGLLPVQLPLGLLPMGPLLGPVTVLPPKAGHSRLRQPAVRVPHLGWEQREALAPSLLVSGQQMQLALVPLPAALLVPLLQPRVRARRLLALGDPLQPEQEPLRLAHRLLVHKLLLAPARQLGQLSRLPAVPWVWCSRLLRWPPVQALGRLLLVGQARQRLAQLRLWRKPTLAQRSRGQRRRSKLPVPLQPQRVVAWLRHSRRERKLL